MFAKPVYPDRPTAALERPTSFYRPETIEFTEHHITPQGATHRRLVRRFKPDFIADFHLGCRHPNELSRSQRSRCRRRCSWRSSSQIFPRPFTFEKFERLTKSGFPKDARSYQTCRVLRHSRGIFQDLFSRTKNKYFRKFRLRKTRP